MSFDFQEDTLYLSGVDIISGTPVLDIKPYIPDYDSPTTRTDNTSSEHRQTSSFTDPQVPQDVDLDVEPDILQASFKHSSELCPETSISCPASDSDLSWTESSKSRDVSDMLAEVKDYLKQEQFTENKAEDKTKDALGGSLTGTTPISSSSSSFGEELHSSIAAWVRAPPVSNLDVRFTVHAEKELKEFVPIDSTGTAVTNFLSIYTLYSQTEFDLLFLVIYF